MPSIKRGRYESLLNTIYSVAGDPARWPDVLTQVSDYLGADGGMLIHIGPPGERSFAVLGRINEEIAATFWEHYVWNPWSIGMTGIPFGQAVTASRLTDRGSLRRTAFYADIVQPMGTEEMVAVSLKELTIKGGVGGFNFGLSPRGEKQTSESMRRFTRVLPHLTRALDASLQVGKVRGWLPPVGESVGPHARCRAAVECRRTNYLCQPRGGSVVAHA